MQAIPPQRQQSALASAQQRALIPQSTIDFPSQRYYALSLLAVLQGLKLYDLVNVYSAAYPEQYSGMLMKWWLLDALYLFGLWILQIPWLQFSGIKTILFVILTCFINLVLFALPSAAISSALFKVFFGDVLGQQIGISRAKLVNVKDIVFNSSHILGRHTVHILPYGTAKLNPNDEFYCIPGNEVGQKDIFIPIVLNNTIPRSITVSRYDFDTTSRTVSEHSGRDIQRATEIAHGKQGLEYYYIRVRNPGVYKLENIVSKEGLDVRLYSRQVYVFVCPTARFVPKDSADYCKGEKEQLQLDVFGVPPLKVEYTRSINDKQTHLKLDRIQPDTFDSPLARIPGGLRHADPEFFSPLTHTSYDWGAMQHLSLDMNLTFDQDGEYRYQIQRIVDGAGNTIEFENGYQQHFSVHRQPQVSFECSATDPVDLLIGKNAVDLPLKLKGSHPYKLEYEFVSPDNDAQRQLVELKDTSAALKATAPGEYRLLKVSDRFCKGDVYLPASCQVIQPPLPAVQVQATPIPSECAGDSEIGMKFAVELSGSPPFALEYVVTKQNGRKKTVVERKKEKIDRSRFMFQYLPSSSGEYTYEFTALDDRNYKQQETKVQPIKQTVHPQPDAKFSKKMRSIRTCMGEEVNLDVELSGSGPFTLYWSFDKQMYSESVDNNKLTINVPRLETPGQHTVSLVKIQDANACLKELDTRDVVIDVRRDRPTAFFYTDNNEDATVSVAQGEYTELPLRLTGEGPWHVTYRNIQNDKKGSRTVTLKDPNAHVRVKDVGEYELLSVKDAICEGDVLPPHYFLRWIDKPTLSFPENQVSVQKPDVYERAAVCEGVSDAVDVLFSGQGPFHSTYDIYHGRSQGKASTFVSSEDISAGLSKSRIALTTRSAGHYRYVFKEISDQRYTRPLKLSPATFLEQTVYAVPSVKYASKSRRERNVCVGDTFASDDVGAIWLDLTGQAPFTVQLGLKHQSEVYGRVLTFNDIQSTRFKVEIQDQVMMPGQYELTLIDVTDDHGCHASATGPESMITIQALDIATIVPSETCSEHCVGDTLEFSLSGIGPFTISYQFNGRDEKVKSQSSRLTMIADKPGNLTILSVGDQRNKCRSFPKDMTKIVHEIPSSLVSGGKEIIENIREGDMVQAIVDLVGTPPFDFEWQRSDAIWDTHQNRYYKGAVLETHTVHNVEGHRYYINTSMEGIIEVVSIRDQFCHYPRARA
ncbi:hypothetical protein BCR43DRAFT_489127 [Syncephalastrum racemosum]|uniref:Nucleoporin Pom152 n=1 Tax=Syncephalastrum racemosum TaxID=13706 RepID=A0A1X2HJR5_SYNRA|nr:hypothetical protein BCR43DRAFT_489127 [Syncephalastrum racemosum]